MKGLKIEKRIYLGGANTARLKGLLRDPFMRLARDVDTKIVFSKPANDFHLRDHKSNNASILAAQMRSFSLIPLIACVM